MLTEPQPTPIAIFVDRSQCRWVVLDREGNFWTVPSSHDGWERRQPFQIVAETDLQPVPGHYKHSLGLPS